MARTEEQKVCRAPIIVTFGSNEYEIQPLVIRDSRVWRAEIVDILSDLPKFAKATTDKPDEFGDALQALLIKMPDTVIDLFFKYAKDLKREEIEAIATDEEMAEAFEQVVKLAFPLARSLVGSMEALGQ